MFLALEGFARLIPLWPDKLSDFDPELGFSHVPGAEGWWVNISAPFEFRTRVEISSQGLRDREFEFEKPEGIERILIIGDSMVDGLEVPLGDTFPKQLELIYLDSGRGVEVINGGHYGYGTDQELLFYRLRGRQFHPDIVVLGFSPSNDIAENLESETLSPKPFFEFVADGTLELKNFPVSPMDENIPARSTILEQIKQTLYDKSKLYRFTSYQVMRQVPWLRQLLAGIGVVDPEGDFERESTLETYSTDTSNYFQNGWEVTSALILRLREEVEVDGAQFAVVIMPDPRQFVYAGMPGQHVTKWNERMMLSCGNQNMDCIDLFPVFQSLVEDGEIDSYFYPRDGHPNSAGHRIIAETLYTFLEDRFH